ncbi:MAG: hypothetical protein Kow0098_04610 [Ignavibacteriaceae bacterium]
MKPGKMLLRAVILITTGIISCNTTNPPTPPGQPKAEITLEFEDVSCTEAWITLTTKNLQLPTTVTLYKDTVGQTISLSTADTVIYVDSLLPNQTYTFHTTIQSSSYASNEITVTTMDTTSHDFTFETYTFGGTAGSSALYDVAIIDENNIWAVGEIYVADASQNGYTMYNAVHWDGSEWELKTIPFLFQGDSFYNPIYAVFAFGPDDIWFGIGNLIYWDGLRYMPIEISSVFPSLVNKIWGTSSNDLYVVGNEGNIAHYEDGVWSKIESGTDLNINDIWGDYNEKTGEWEILAVASNKFFNEGKSLLKIGGLITTELNTEGLPWSVSSVWFKAEKKYLIGGDGLFFNKMLNESWNKDTTFIPIYKDRIRGTDVNDIVVSGSNGLFSHFNGFKWKHYTNNELPYFSGRLLSSDLKDDVSTAVGWKDTQAIITMGKR